MTPNKNLVISEVLVESQESMKRDYINNKNPVKSREKNMEKTEKKTIE